MLSGSLLLQPPVKLDLTYASNQRDARGLQLRLVPGAFKDPAGTRKQGQIRLTKNTKDKVVQWSGW